MKEKGFTFALAPGGKTRRIAGPYDLKSRTPRYELEVMPDLYKRQVSVEQCMLGSEENCSWCWDITNNSDIMVFVAVRKDGELMKE